MHERTKQWLQNLMGDCSLINKYEEDLKLTLYDDFDDFDHPLSNNKDSKYNALFMARLAEEVILLDVSRTLHVAPNMHCVMVNILLVYAVSHDLPYKQGMSDICGVLMCALEETSKSEQYAVFCAIAYKQNKVYTQCQQISNDMFNIFLRKVDAELFDCIRMSLLRATATPQIFGVRFVKLLFAREFDIDQTIELWDALFLLSNTVPWFALLCCVGASLVRVL